MADLSKADEKPAVAVDGLLRALRAANPGTGLDYERAIRLAFLGADYSAAVAPPALPEALFGLLGAAVPGLFTGHQVTAGVRGCWLQWFSGFPNFNMMRADNEAGLAANPSTIIATHPALWSINGGVSTIVQTVNMAAGDPFVTATSALIGGLYTQWSIGWHKPGLGLWIPPGGIFRFSTSAANSQLQIFNIVREPLAGP